MTKSPTRFYILLFILIAIQILYYYPQLPYMVISHFNIRGEPDGWAFKQFFFIGYVSIILLISGIFLLMPAMLRRLPQSLINLPNKSYWLAEERKEETIAFIKQKTQWFGLVTLMLLMWVVQLTIIANLSDPKRLSPRTILILLGIYFIYTASWFSAFFKRFKTEN